MVYLTFFSISLILIRLNEIVKSHRHIIRNIFTLTAILILSVLAGLRNINIGIDVTWYVTNNIDLARSLSFSDYLNNTNVIDLLFSCVLYTTANLSKGTFLTLFTIHLLILIPLFIASYRLKEKFSMFLFWGLYLACYFNPSLCLMRQSIAASFLFLATVNMYNKKKIQSIVCMLIAFGFHKTSTVISFIILYSFLFKNHKILLILPPFFLSLFLVFNKSLIDIINNFGFINQKYLNALNERGGMSSLGIESTFFNVLLYTLPIIFFNKNKFIRQSLCFLLLGLVFSFAGLVNEYFIRFEYYFSIFAYASFAIMIKKFKSSDYVILMYVVIVALLVHWGWNNIHSDVWETNPYLIYSR